MNDVCNLRLKEIDLGWSAPNRLESLNDCLATKKYRRASVLMVLCFLSKVVVSMLTKLPWVQFLSL